MSYLSRLGCIAIGIALLSSTGCGGYGKKLVGTWEGGGDGTPLGKLSTVTAEFRADGTAKMEIGGLGGVSGNYKITTTEGTTLTVQLDVTSVELFGKSEAKKETNTFTVTFVDDDTITLSSTKKPDPKTLKRKK